MDFGIRKKTNLRVKSTFDSWCFLVRVNRRLDPLRPWQKLQNIYNVIMDSISFSWDNRKNSSNEKKHGVSFEEAQSVFFDENAIEYFDPDHSESEDRFLILGHSYRLRVLVISHTLVKDGIEIRIISARKATKKEQKAYFGEKLWEKNTIFQIWKDAKTPMRKGWKNK